MKSKDDDKQPHSEGELRDATIEALKERAMRDHHAAHGTRDPLKARIIRRMADETDDLAERIKRKELPHQWRNHGSYTDQRGASGNSSITQVESNRLLPWLLLSALMCGLAIGISFLAISDANKAERETKLLREDVRVMSIALARRGIDTDEHGPETGEQK